jgi:hypothetical protein
MKLPDIDSDGFIWTVLGLMAAFGLVGSIAATFGAFG